MQDVLRSRDEKDILKFSLLCRSASVALALLSSIFVKAFDTSGLLLLEDAGGPLSRRLALPFVQWDTLHFLKIAKDGYVQEQSFAFMPGVPLILRASGKLLNQDFQVVQAVLCTVVLVNIISIFLPVLLYRLSLHLLGSPSLARKASLLYVLAPAPAIFSVPYTEPFFATFTFLGMLYVKKQRYILASIAFAASTCFRATGVLNAGFLVWYLIWRSPSRRFSMLLRRTVLATCLSALVAAPFLWQQYIGYQSFCTGDVKRPWCTRQIPLIYSFVQEHYWDVGFLRYFTVTQIPNFILAAPVLAMSFAASYSYYSARWPNVILESLPLRLSPAAPTKEEKPFHRLEFLPFVHLHTLLAILLLTTSHVQIALRQACTNPVLFWYVAQLAEDHSKYARWWIKYCIIWGSVSIVLWTAFYPPA